MLSKKGKLLLELGLVIFQCGGEPAFIVADQQWSFFGDHPLHAVTPDLLTVGEMTDDLEGTPFARHRSQARSLGSGVRSATTTRRSCVTPFR